MKKKYTIAVTEILRCHVDVKAETELDALRIVKEDYDNKSIILNSDNYIETDFKLINSDK